MDVHLTPFGRKQAFLLNQVYEQHSKKFHSVFCSDLKRSFDTAFYALAFPDDGLIQKSKLLRELNFGKQEGLHFDGLPQSEKLRFSQPDFQAEDGESWPQLRTRAIQFMNALPKNKSHLVFTHGGWIASYLRAIDDAATILPNCSVVGVRLCQHGEPEAVDFQWEFPYIEEDI
jgi:broad specificity phosphatase PhoE